MLLEYLIKSFAFWLSLDESISSTNDWVSLISRFKMVLNGLELTPNNISEYLKV